MTLAMFAVGCILVGFALGASYGTRTGASAVMEALLRHIRDPDVLDAIETALDDELDDAAARP